MEQKFLTWSQYWASVTPLSLWEPLLVAQRQVACTILDLCDSVQDFSFIFNLTT